MALPVARRAWVRRAQPEFDRIASAAVRAPAPGLRCLLAGSRGEAAALERIAWISTALTGPATGQRGREAAGEASDLRRHSNGLEPWQLLLVCRIVKGRLLVAFVWLAAVRVLLTHQSGIL
jgi:hypothetical protein